MKNSLFTLRCVLATVALLWWGSHLPSLQANSAPVNTLATQYDVVIQNNALSPQRLYGFTNQPIRFHNDDSVTHGLEFNSPPPLIRKIWKWWVEPFILIVVSSLLWYLASKLLPKLSQDSKFRRLYSPQGAFLLLLLVFVMVRMVSGFFDSQDDKDLVSHIAVESAKTRTAEGIIDRQTETAVASAQKTNVAALADSVMSTLAADFQGTELAKGQLETQVAEAIRSQTQIPSAEPRRYAQPLPDNPEWLPPSSMMLGPGQMQAVIYTSPGIGHVRCTTCDDENDDQIIIIQDPEDTATPAPTKSSTPTTTPTLTPTETNTPVPTVTPSEAATPSPTASAPPVPQPRPRPQIRLWKPTRGVLVSGCHAPFEWEMAGSLPGGDLEFEIRTCVGPQCVPSLGITKLDVARCPNRRCYLEWDPGSGSNLYRWDVTLLEKGSPRILLNSSVDIFRFDQNCVILESTKETKRRPPPITPQN